MRRALPPIILLAGLWGGPLAQAQSLVDLYQAARGHDATYLSAKAQVEANRHRAEQARAGVLPTVGLSAGASRSNFDSNNPVTERSFGTRNATLAASQPLYRPANLASYEQGRRQLLIADAQLLSAEQDLIVRLSQAYFDLLASIDNLTFVRAQKTAVAEQLAFAKRNFEVGSATITDTREAQARFDLVTAQEIAADNDVRVRRLALEVLVGKTGVEPRPLAVPLQLPPIVPDNIETWVRQADEQHPGVRSARSALEVAELETRKAEAGHLPTLDLTLSHNITRNAGGAAVASPQGALDSRSNLSSAGLVFNLPLFAGFAVQNRVRETLALEDKARADLEAARRGVAQGTRAAFLGLVAGNGQVKALEAAEASSQSALDANKLGYQVGVRINIDVLNAQSQLFQTKRDLARARYDVLLGGLRLRQASGSLQASDLQPINALLAR